MEGASCINLGHNTPHRFQSHKKHNQGFGTIGGDHNLIEGARTMLHDPDTFDLADLSQGELPKWMASITKLNGAIEKK